MRFTSDNPGLIQAIRYYKSPSETGTHVGHIWSSTGQPLATITFTNEGASGWQQQALATPLTINAGTTYVVSVNANSYYAVTSQGFASVISNGGLNAPVGAGVYNYNAGVFPSRCLSERELFPRCRVRSRRIESQQSPRRGEHQRHADAEPDVDRDGERCGRRAGHSSPISGSRAATAPRGATSMARRRAR